jgi:hypothetical protein
MDTMATIAIVPIRVHHRESMPSVDRPKTVHPWTMDVRPSAPIAILAGAALIALAILVVFRWEIVSGANGTLRLDRWSGRIAICGGVDKNTFETSCGVEFIKSLAPK